MKKIAVFILALLCAVALVGCSPAYTKGSVLLKKGTVARISVSSLPEGYDYSYTGQDAQAIVNYLSNLELLSDFEENPDEYGGMTWVIALEYEDGSKETIYHFGNMFIRNSGGSWCRMTYEQASAFDRLLDELNGH
ncbi:MAG: hypothetical protein E7625_02590 [Ruminococcaceae bacterium]|nr:hypothetical protein [Oscillospiraceae bacterium]